MALEKFYLYFKTNLKADEFLTADKIAENKDFNAETDHLFISSCRDGFANFLNEIFEKLNQNFNLAFLGRVPNSEHRIFNGPKMPKSVKTALNCWLICPYYLHNLPCFDGDLVYFYPHYPNRDTP